MEAALFIQGYECSFKVESAISESAQAISNAVCRGTAVYRNTAVYRDRGPLLFSKGICPHTRGSSSYRVTLITRIKLPHTRGYPIDEPLCTGEGYRLYLRLGIIYQVGLGIGVTSRSNACTKWKPGFGKKIRGISIGRGGEDLKGSKSVLKVWTVFNRVPHCCVDMCRVLIFTQLLRCMKNIRVPP